MVQPEPVKMRFLMMVACKTIRQKNTDLASALITNFPDLLLQSTSTGNTLLQLSFKSCNTELSLALIKNMSLAQLNKRDSKGYTYLHKAGSLKSEGLAIIDALISKGVSLVTRDLNDLAPLDFFIMKGYKVAALHLIKYMSAHELNYKPNTAEFPLIAAINMAHISLVREMLKKYVFLSIDDSKGKTVLHLAILKNYVSLAKEIIKKMETSQLSEVDSEGNTALHLAIHKNQVSVA